LIQSDSIASDVIAQWTGITWDSVRESALRILLIIALSWFAFWFLRVLLRRLERAAISAGHGIRTIEEQRVMTLVSLARSVGSVVIVVAALFMVLEELGLAIGTLLAGAGVIGLAISFGAQSLVRDIISGLFILFENQFGVGDVIRTSGVSGKVEKMTLRIVVLRDLEGAMHVIPNGSITMVSNLTRAFSRAVVEVHVGYREDADRVIAVLREVAEDVWKDPEWQPLLTEVPTVPGIESFGEAYLTIRVIATTLPLKQWDVARELRRRIKVRFDAEGIVIPTALRPYVPGAGQQSRAIPSSDPGGPLPFGEGAAGG
jgi:small-conductance mechanosensitive channel